MKNLCSVSVLFAVTLFSSLIGFNKANAFTSLSINVTFDNHGAVFIGNEDASQFQFIGRDTVDTGQFFPTFENCNSFFSWECVDSFFIDKIHPDYIQSKIVDNLTQFYTYLYFPVWSDFSVDDMIIAEIIATSTSIVTETNSGRWTQISTSTSIVTETNSGRWTQISTSINTPGDLGDVPSDIDLIQEIQDASANNEWIGVTSLGQNNGTTYPWNLISPIAEISEDAHFLGLLDSQTVNVFRLEIPIKCIPEPLTILGVTTAIGFGSFFKYKLKHI